ncbi:ATP-binding cassette domain-containing protein [Carboxylicivirga sp. N1Y90]|uniref:ATP-binding cassette domain-containing protein n=1 Tax=Carboxylicivirga fragile TaxID=3417571 RepID=UPI003D340B7C|nr:ABC transporter ATP-binding protein [Marinilabiliaceae bacterium N1Y90]
MIELFDLQKVYGEKIALSVDALKINSNECVGLVGNNGAGKTTMLSLVLDLIKADKGYVTSKSVKVSGSDTWKTYTGSFLDERFLIPFLSPQEYLEFIASLHGRNKSDVEVFLQENERFFNHEDFTGKYIRELSAGNKNKVGILAAILFKPEILILDEPFSNLDPSSQAWLKIKLKGLQEAGTTLLISSHDLNHVTEVCNRIILLEEGGVKKDIYTKAETLPELEAYFNV